jgi:hypothetical protein
VHWTELRSHAKESAGIGMIPVFHGQRCPWVLK